MKEAKLAFVSLSAPIVAMANVGNDILEKDGPDDDDGLPDWLSFLLLLFVVLMVLGKIKR